MYGKTKKLNHEAFLEQAKQYDKNVKVYSFQVGEKVWMQNNRLAVGKSKKLSKKFLGPFKILERISPVLVKLQLPNSQSTHCSKSIVHCSKLKPHRSRPQYLSASLCPQPTGATQSRGAAAPPRSHSQQSATATPPAAEKKLTRVKLDAPPTAPRPPVQRDYLRNTTARQKVGFYKNITKKQ
jgi:hypothetical protein